MISQIDSGTKLCENPADEDCRNKAALLADRATMFKLALQAFDAILNEETDPDRFSLVTVTV